MFSGCSEWPITLGYLAFQVNGVCKEGLRNSIVSVGPCFLEASFVGDVSGPNEVSWPVHPPPKMRPK